MLESYLHKTRMKEEDSCLIKFGLHLKMQRSGQMSYRNNDNNQKSFKGLMERFLYLNLRRRHIQLISTNDDQAHVDMQTNSSSTVRQEERKKKQEKG